MSSLFYRALSARAESYPRLVEETETLYEKAVAKIDALEIDIEKDVVEETERFRENLRAYDLAMKSCGDQAESLLCDVAGDLSSITDYARTGNPDRSLGDLSARLADCYTRLLDIRRSAKEHRKIVEKARRWLAVAQEQKSMGRLRLITQEMRGLDNETREAKD